MAIDAATLAAMESSQIGNWIYLVELNLDSGDLFYTTASAPKLFNGNTYEPLGAIGSISEVEESSNLDPADYSIVIGAVDTAIIQLFLGQNIINRTCSSHVAIVDENQDIIGQPIEYFRGLLQPPLINDSAEPTITIDIRDILADWDRNLESRYTDAEQRRLYPSDYCFEFVSTIAGQEITWPERDFWE